MTRRETPHVPGAIGAVLKWVHFYTQFVPPEMAENRRDEIRSDIFEQQCDARGGVPLSRVQNFRIALRAARGVIADISWCGSNFVGRNRESLGLANKKRVDGSRRRKWAIALWLTFLTIALSGVAASVSELLQNGGQRLGYVPWPGADNINVALVFLAGSAGSVVIAITIAAVDLRQRRADK